MSLLIYDDLIKKIENRLDSGCKSLSIITAFCKLDTLKYIDSLVPKNIIKKIIVRFRLDDLISRVTDKEIYNYCQKNNWQLYINLDLHAKVYLIDNICFIGSANATNKGLSLSKLGNLEISKEFEITNEEKDQLNKIFCESKLLDDELYNQMMIQLESINTPKIIKYKWNDAIIKEYNQSYNLLFQEDFPINFDPKNLEEDEKYLEIYKDDSLEKIKNEFEDTKIFKWLISVLLEKPNKEIYFGELSVKIHEIIFQEPKQFRKNVKELEGRLINWLSVLNYDYVVIDKPNYSTRIKLLVTKSGQLKQ